jgi:hypothetical protein
MLKPKTIAVLVLTALGYLAPIAWDLWSTSPALSLVISGPTLLFQKLDGFDRLEATFKGREIDKLFSTEISIENSGWKAISKEDIIKPVVVTFADAPILGVALKERFPENLEYSIKLNHAEVEVGFDVLNRREKVVLNVLTDQEPKGISGRIRAKGLSEISVRNNVGASTVKKFPTSLFIATAFSILYMIFAVYFARKELGPLRRDAYALGDLDVGFSKDKLMAFLRVNIWPKLTEMQKEHIKAHIERMNPTDESEAKMLAREITYQALRRDPSGALAITLVIAFVAFLYGSIQLARTFYC